MCAICCAHIYKIKPKKIRQALLDFIPQNYRIQYINNIGGVNFYNDSKSTNISSTLASVETIKGSIILILGGSHKALDYKELFDNLTKRVKFIVVYGQIADILEQANNNKFKIAKATTLEQAFSLAVNTAKKNDNILLSPATASYDQYSSFIERGKDFNRLVENYATKKE